jgi:hypothetical protein
MSDRLLDRIVTRAGARLAADLQRDLPAAGAKLRRHLRRVPSLTNSSLSLRPQAFPIFEIPYWMTPASARRKDAAFQEDMAYSTFSGYYGIRLIDNITDRDGPKELPALLPTTGYFHWRFLQPYLKYFPDGHAFWPEFHRVWSEQAELTAEDALARDITQDVFDRVSARKFGAIKVPAAAVAFRYDRPALREPWYDFVDALGSFVQFWNDFLDWQHDADHGIVTFLQSESRRRRAHKETHNEWFLREGFAWGRDRLRVQMRRVVEQGNCLRNRGLADWLATRAALLNQQLSTLARHPAATGKGSFSLGDRGSKH